MRRLLFGLLMIVLCVAGVMRGILFGMANGWWSLAAVYAPLLVLFWAVTGGAFNLRLWIAVKQQHRRRRTRGAS